MKIKIALVCLIACFMSVFSFAENETMSYYRVSSEKLAEYLKNNLQNDSAKIGEFVNSFKNTADTLLGKLSMDASAKAKIKNELSNWYQDSLELYAKDELYKQERYTLLVEDVVRQMNSFVFMDSMHLRHYAKNLIAMKFNICDKDSIVGDSEKKSMAKLDSILKKSHERNQNENPNIRHKQMTTDTERLIKKVKRKVGSDFEKNEKLIKRYSGRICSDDLWKNAFERLDTLYSRLFLKSVNASIVQVDKYDDKASVDLNKKSCGCSHKEELNGEVIGIYPYWFAADSTKWVDLEGITRLAYYGLRASEDGSLLMPSGSYALPYLDKEENYEFVNVAHRHNVKVDWIVTRDNWDSVGLDQFFAKLSNDVDTLLSRRVNSYFQRFVNIFTFYTDELEHRGDGVTFFFKNYPKTEEATGSFEKFINSLKVSLAEKNPYVHVNVMMNRDDVAVDEHELYADSLEGENLRGIYSYKFFLKISDNSTGSQNYTRKQIRENVKNYMLVVMDEPSSRNKQLILNDLNMQLDGYDRRNMLHSLVPVVMFDSTEWTSFNNDILYYNDSYYNLALAPFVSNLDSRDVCDASGNLGTCTLQYFVNEKGKGIRQGGFSAFICMHRWVFRFLNLITLLIAIGVLVSYFVSCTVSEYFNNHLAILLGVVVAPSAVMMTLLSRLDPSLVAYRGSFGMIPIILLLATVVAIILIQVYRKNDLPTRRGR